MNKILVEIIAGIIVKALFGIVAGVVVAFILGLIIMPYSETSAAVALLVFGGIIGGAIRAVPQVNRVYPQIERELEAQRSQKTTARSNSTEERTGRIGTTKAVRGTESSYCRG